MGDAGSKTGAVGIIDAFTTLLQTYLQACLNEIGTDLGETALSAPDSTNGYSKSRVMPRDITPAIQIVKASSDYFDEIYNVGGSRRKNQLIEITAQLATLDISDVERALGIYARGIEVCLTKWWRTSALTTRLQKILITTEEQNSSLREQFRQEGLILRGQPPDDQSEQVKIMVACVQRVWAPIEFSI